MRNCFTFLNLSFNIIYIIINTALGNMPREYVPQYSNPFSESWRWRNYPELNGKGCRCMVEDATGNLWFGVSGGVIRYDGLEWKSFPIYEDSVNVDVVSLCTAEDGTIYGGTNKAIVKFSDNKWQSLNLNFDFGDPDEYYLNKIPIISGSDGSIWIGSKQGAIRIKDNETTLYRPDFDEKILLSKDDIFDIYSIYDNGNGEIWFGLRDGRIFKCRLRQNASPQWQRIDTDKNYVHIRYPLISKNDKGKIFIASSGYDGSINIFSDNKWKNIKLKEKLQGTDIYNDIIRLADGSICIAGLGSIIIEKSEKWQMYQSPEYPFASNRLIVYQTEDNNLWIIGLANEVWKIDLSQIHWSTLLGLIFQGEDLNGRLWYISFEGHIVCYEKSEHKWSEYDISTGIIDDPVRILITKNGHIWIAGSDRQIAATAYLNGNKWIRQVHPTLGWGIDRRAVFEASDGSIWFGASADIDETKGQKGGLVRYKNIDYKKIAGIDFEYHHPDETFSLESVYAIDQTTDGLVWVGQSKFYNYDLDTDSWSNITEPEGLDESFIDCIDVSSSGNLWVGTRTNGLFRRDNRGKWYNFTIEKGLSSNAIINIYAEADNSVWISTDKDIAHYDGHSWLSSTFSGYFKNIRDGISIHKTNKGSFWINQNPPAWFRKSFYNEKPEIELFSGFKTTKYFPDTNPPDTEIRFSQAEISQPGNVFLSWMGNDPWKSTPSAKLQYSFRIDDNPWSAFSEKTSEIFLAVDKGYHTFQVRARDMELNVDESPASASFYIIPPVWQQLWFLLLIFVFLSIITFFMIYLYHRNKIISEISESKARLFANISHELRTPLVLILGPVSRVLQSPQLDRQLVKPLERVYKNTQRLLRLVNQVLDFRKMEVGQLKFEPAKGDIIAFLKEETFVFEEAVEAKNIRLTFNSAVTGLQMWFDFDKIEKIIFNILSNALKYTPEKGQINVNVSVQQNQKTRSFVFRKRPVHFRDYLKIVITDSGVGIPKRNLGRIFDRFYQAENQAKLAVGGTGIGLALARELLHIHHGSIHVESEEDVGTTFFIHVPLIEEALLDNIVNQDETESKQYIKFRYPEQEPSEKQVEAVRSGNGNGDKTKILIVEDNHDMREYIAEELGQEFEISLAKNGSSGFEKAVQENPDLIISDIMMPQMDGIDFCKKIKTDEKTSHIAVILLTARSSREDKLEGLQTGADDYLTKPFYIDELRLRINNMIASRKKFREQFGKTLEIEPTNIQITSVDEKFIRQAIQIVEENITDHDFDVEKFSQLIGISRVGLYNKIKALTNQTVQEFIFIIKLKRAAQLLRESGMTVSEICYEVGFKDPSHFSKLFKKQFGIPPKLYKNEHSAQPSKDIY